MTEPSNSISFDYFHPSPLFLVISGPSGVGKDAVIQKLKSHDLALHVIVTMTTRAPRENETDGVDYFFVSKEHFEGMISKNALIEHSLVYTDYKGIPREQVQAAFDSGLDVIIRVDVQGAEKLRQIFPEAVMIFLIPHDEMEWRERLKNRKTETEDSYNKRVETAREEMRDLKRFDYVVVNANDRLQDAVDTIIAIINAEHHRVVPRRVAL